MIAISLASGSLAEALDRNENQQSDVWEMIHGVSGLGGAGDLDDDGWTNAMEATAGTDPADPVSFPRMEIEMEAGLPSVFWQSQIGKRYLLQAGESPVSFTPLGPEMEGSGGTMERTLDPEIARRFFRLQALDVDSDGDGANDWEELAVGFDPGRTQTDRYEDDDDDRIAAGITAENTVTVAVYDESCSERWPDPAVLVLRRGGGLKPLAVNFSLGGSAVAGTDYQVGSAGSVAFAPGQREAFIEINPVADAEDGEAAETVTLSLLAGTGYTIGATNSASILILNETAASAPSAKAAARFLIQAAFGPDQDSAADADHIPENVEELMAAGFAGWIDDQLARPVGTLRPMVQWQNEQPTSGENNAEIYNDRKQNAWWGRAMGLPNLRPDATETRLPDPLRQRIGYALSQIYVISDRMERLGVEPEGMVHFYDKLLENSFGNFKDLLRDVTLHPCMGLYLSHLGNRKSDPLARTFPDENYAREIMQLFSIGLWMLNPDGTLQLDPGGAPIPTYNNSDITEIARVFTGLSFGRRDDGDPNLNFELYDGDFTAPMAGFDAEHDLGAKTLLLGATTPQRQASPGTTGDATMADVEAVMDNLFNHPNVGPFIGRQLIQRLVTSNPSPEYVGRVAAAFNAMPRGDMGRTVKAILLDPEARDPAMMADPAFGKLREPFLRTVNLARAFNARSEEGWYYLDAFSLDHVQEPFKAPSVFNYYLPAYSPPGALARAGLAAPEMQIVNASSGVTAPNYFWNSIDGGLHRWGVGRPERNVTLNLDQEMRMNVPEAALEDPSPSIHPLDPDALIRRLDLVLTGGTLGPRSFQIIREALVRIGPGSGWEWPRSRLKLAIYLIVCSPEFSIQR